MAVFTKEKNIIKFGVDEKKVYTYDINTGELIGLKSSVLVRFPTSIDGQFILNNFSAESSYERQMLCLLQTEYNHSKRSRVRDMALFIDKYYAIKDVIPFRDTANVKCIYNKIYNDTETFFKDLKNFMKFAKEKNCQAINHRLYTSYIQQKEKEKYEVYFKNTNFTNEQKEYLLEVINNYSNNYKTPPKVLKNIIK